MSAIWGIVSPGGAGFPAGLEHRMKRCYEKCRIDIFRRYSDERAEMGCGIQFFTRESRVEALPASDAEGRAVFTADIILDNRRELLDMLGMGDNLNDIPDGTIAFEMFKRYGGDCLDSMLGAYALVYYDKELHRVSMALDCTGNRCLYYSVENGVLYFSTLLEPLVKTGSPKSLNERWIACFLAQDSMTLMAEPATTPYNGIYRVLPGDVVTFDGENLETRTYWDPSPESGCVSTDAEYKARLREIYKTSVSCLLRAEKTSILLSEGLDSTSVACYAARELRGRGETLYSYTSVPEAGYISDLPSRSVTDESAGVLRTKEYLESEGCSLSCRFLNLDGLNGWDGRHRQMEIMEAPYKSLQNYLWLHEASEQAYLSGSRIMLTGGYGNISISESGRRPYLNHLLKKGRFISFLREYHKFSKVSGLRRKAEIKGMLYVLKDALLKPVPYVGSDRLFGKSFVREELLEKHGLRPLFEDMEKTFRRRLRSFDEYKELLVHRMYFCQVGEAATHLSLFTGVIQRDPTMDKRLIEFCLSLPPGQMARDGVTRRLVREYMKDDMPAHVMDPRKRGVQSADTAARMSHHWDRIFEEISSIYESLRDNPYVDCGRALAELENIRESPENIKSFDLLRLCYTAMALEFACRAQASPSADN